LEKTDDVLDYRKYLEQTHSIEFQKTNQSILVREFAVKQFLAVELNEDREKDYVFIDRNDKKNKVEFKNYIHHKNSNVICLEVYHDVATQFFGWTFRLIQNEVNYVVFVWQGKAKLCYLILHGSLLEHWWRENWQKYEMPLNRPTHNHKRGLNWRSSFCRVPIKDLPTSIIYKRKRFADLFDFIGGN